MCPIDEDVFRRLWKGIAEQYLANICSYCEIKHPYINVSFRTHIFSRPLNIVIVIDSYIFNCVFDVFKCTYLRCVWCVFVKMYLKLLNLARSLGSFHNFLYKHVAKFAKLNSESDTEQYPIFNNPIFFYKKYWIVFTYGVQ